MNLADLGIQLTRTSRALKVWLSLCAFGVDAFAATIDRCLDLAEAARRRIDESPTLELAVAAVALGRLLPPPLRLRRRRGGPPQRGARRGARAQRHRPHLVDARRRRATCCACASSGTRRSWEHVERVIAFLERTEVEAAPTATAYERHPDVARSWLAGAESGVADLERLPIFRSLRPRRAGAARAGRRAVRGGRRRDDRRAVGRVEGLLRRARRDRRRERRGRARSASSARASSSASSRRSTGEAASAIRGSRR